MASIGGFKDYPGWAPWTSKKLYYICYTFIKYIKLITLFYLINLYLISYLKRKVNHSMNQASKPIFSIKILRSCLFLKWHIFNS